MAAVLFVFGSFFGFLIAAVAATEKEKSSFSGCLLVTWTALAATLATLTALGKV